MHKDSDAKSTQMTANDRLVHFMAELSFRSRKTASLERCCRLSLKYSVSVTSALSARDQAIRHPRMQINA